jgi:sulfotransferase family protein
LVKHKSIDPHRPGYVLEPLLTGVLESDSLERAAQHGRGGRITFVYRNPLSPAASYFHYCREHKDPGYSVFKGRRLADVPLQDFLFEGGVVSYAKMFLSFQAMAAKDPARVCLTPYEQLMVDPVTVLADILDHLSERPGKWRWLPQAVSLARLEHLKAIELELGRSLDGTRNGGGSHMRQGSSTWSEPVSDSKLRPDTIALLRQMGVNTDLFEWPPMVEHAAVA